MTEDIMTENIYPEHSVAEVAAYIHKLIRRSAYLSAYWICGELSGVKRYSSGHIYFTIKDEQAQLSCVMYNSNASRLSFPLKDGKKVKLRCKIDFYEARGQCQLIVLAVEEAGSGQLYAKYLALKEKLAAEGLFANARPLPLLPRRVGVITSPSGAVIQDICNVSCRRFPAADILLYPAAVQGETAAATLRRGILLFNRLKNVDVIIIGRGGGSIEDLWPFNDEELARAVAASEIPVVSAVGHETDYTICDFVADHRAPTPSAAAEMVWPVRDELQTRIAGAERRMAFALERNWEAANFRYSHCAAHFTATQAAALFNKFFMAWQTAVNRLQNQHPLRQAERNHSQIENLFAAASQHIRYILLQKEQQWHLQTEKLNNLNPLNVLMRGFGLVTDKNDAVAVSTAKILPGDNIKVTLQDGKLACKVLAVEKINGKGVTCDG